MRLIDADALCMVTDGNHDYYERFEIDNAPTVDHVKHGHWITWFENEDVRQAKCSECGMMFTLGKGRDIHYCGNCGCKMDEVEENG